MEEASKPKLIDVKIKPSEHGRTIGSKHQYFTVSPVWEAVDRPISTSWCVRDIYVERLVRAIRAGVACGNPHVRTDIHGKTYIEFEIHVSAKYVNADLKKLGF